MTQIAKAVALVSGLGALGGIGAYSAGLFSNEPASEKEEIKQVSARDSLKNEGFEILDNTKDSSAWQLVLQEYKKETTKTFLKKQEQNKTEAELKDDCSKALNENSENLENYLLAKRWCVIQETMDKVLERGKRKLLTSENTIADGEKEHWTTKINKLKTNKDAFPAIKEQIKDGESHLDENIGALRKGCVALKIKTMKTTEEKFSENLALAREWCAIENN